ncbi:uncharacterized protein [Elaeis guineensis]|uniref:Uncharacterized protein LOC105042776 n=1 Tax=Elaeis guineensis var. tenera TaxID=51953 RepID=A0A6I9R690_ELAGV|nr:uncharacterized protein LOC105042776 [Elaeis guineensis]
MGSWTIDPVQIIIKLTFHRTPKQIKNPTRLLAYYERLRHLLTFFVSSSHLGFKDWPIGATATGEASGIQAAEEERNSNAGVETTPACGEPATASFRAWRARQQSRTLATPSGSTSSPTHIPTPIDSSPSMPSNNASIASSSSK